MNYEIIYKAANSYEAHFIKGLLKKYSIESKLLGEKFKNFQLRSPEGKLDILESVLCTKDGKLRSSKTFPTLLPEKRRSSSPEKTNPF